MSDIIFGLLIGSSYILSLILAYSWGYWVSRGWYDGKKKKHG